MKTIMMRKLTAMAIMVLALEAPAFCLDRPPLPGGEKGKAETVIDRQSIAATGRVVHVDLEGGFWGIVGDDGTQYDVVDLPREFRKQGLKVRFTAKARSGGVSFHMWGVIIELVTIEKIGGEEQ